MARPKMNTAEKRVIKVYVSPEMYKVIAHKAIDSEMTPDALVHKTIEGVFTPPSAAKK